MAVWRLTPPRPKKLQVQKSARKVPTSNFWDQDGILLIDYLPKDQTINAEYYSSLLVQLKDILKEKHHGKVTKGVLFSYDNALAHRSLATQKKLAYPDIQCLDHPPYSPDLAQVRLPPIPWTERTIEVRHFSSNVEVNAAAETWFKQIPEFF